MYRWLILFALALMGAAPAAPSAADPPVITYTLSPELSDGALTALAVEVRFRADPSGTTGFGWQSSWQGDRDLGRGVRDFSVVGATTVATTGNGQWQITAPGGESLTVRYRIVSAYDADPTVEDVEQTRAVIRPRWFFAAGETLFGYPAGSSALPVRFEWRGAPEDFPFASDLEHLDGTGRPGTRPGTVSDVVESIAISGPAVQIFRPEDGAGVRVAMAGDYAFAHRDLDLLARRIIATTREFWDADDREPFLVAAAPLVASATQSSIGGTGRGDGFALWIDGNAPIQRMTWLLAHEYFHSWNPRLLGIPPADRDQATALYWLSEGFTDYYARALMVRGGIISHAEFADQWNEMLVAYAASPARTMTASQAAAAFWTDEAAQRLAYHRGALLAARWNAALGETRTPHTLDTVILAQRRDARTASHDPVTLFRIIAADHGLDIAPDIELHLTRGVPIALAPDTFGRCATIVTERRPVYSRGFDAQATAEAGNIVTGVEPGSTAHAAGLRNGMRIIARVAGVPDDSLAEYALRVDTGGRERVIRYLPQGRERVSVQRMQLVADTNGATDDPNCRASLGGRGEQATEATAQRLSIIGARPGREARTRQ